MQHLQITLGGVQPARTPQSESRPSFGAPGRCETFILWFSGAALDRSPQRSRQCPSQLQRRRGPVGGAAARAPMGCAHSPCLWCLLAASSTCYPQHRAWLTMPFPMRPAAGTECLLANHRHLPVQAAAEAAWIQGRRWPISWPSLAQMRCVLAAGLCGAGCSPRWVVILPMRPSCLPPALPNCLLVCCSRSAMLGCCMGRLHCLAACPCCVCCRGGRSCLPAPSTTS